MAIWPVPGQPWNGGFVGEQKRARLHGLQEKTEVRWTGRRTRPSGNQAFWGRGECGREGEDLGVECFRRASLDGCSGQSLNMLAWIILMLLLLLSMDGTIRIRFSSDRSPRRSTTAPVTDRQSPTDRRREGGVTGSAVTTREPWDRRDNPILPVRTSTRWPVGFRQSGRPEGETRTVSTRSFEGDEPALFWMWTIIPATGFPFSPVRPYDSLPDPLASAREGIMFNPRKRPIPGQSQEKVLSERGNCRNFLNGRMCSFSQGWFLEIEHLSCQYILFININNLNWIDL